MLVFLVIVLVMCMLMASAVYLKKDDPAMTLYSDKFKQLQYNYCIAYCLATFSDWLHGPYDYKLYSDYGYDENAIAVFYVVGFMSSSLSGTVVGHFGDKYSRKNLCASYGIIYSLCGLFKTSSNFNLLILAGITAGMSSAILCSIFESWYVNEHLSYEKFPPEWMHLTFSNVSFYNGLLAIIAGIVAEFISEVLNYGSVAPYLFSIPFLLLSTLFIHIYWNEHPSEEALTENNDALVVTASLKFIFFEENILVLLGMIQIFFECAMYMFIFSWTPILSAIDPPLGLVFSSFMIALMAGSKLYEFLINMRCKPENLLMMTCILGFISFSAVTIIMFTPAHLEPGDTKLPIYICLFCFIVYEMSIGLYMPVMSYLRGRIIPEKYRASVSSWFRFPMNILTCLALLYGNRWDTKVGPTQHGSNKFFIIFNLCSILLLLTSWVSIIFGIRYSRRMEDERTRINTEEKRLATITQNVSVK